MTFWIFWSHSSVTMLTFFAKLRRFTEFSIFMSPNYLKNL